MKTETLHQKFLESTGICTDTRAIYKGCMFVALKGKHYNANNFTGEALKKGAKYVLIDEAEQHRNTGQTILCSNVLTQLQKLATYHRNYLKINIIALTGSNGKTTTKELINAVLSKKYNTTATKGNLNNHIGVPLTLLSMTAKTQMGIVEMGANHKKEIEFLCNISRPDYGYITNFGKAHLAGFGSLQGVIQGKTELYTFCAKNNKTVFVNANDAEQIKQCKGIQKFTFGDNQQDATVQLLKAENTVLVSYKGEKIKSNLIGTYNFHNIAAAIAMGHYFKISAKDIKAAIEGYTPTNKRSQRIKKNGHHIVLDAYNANPTSMMAALQSFERAKGGNKTLFLGDMFELGKNAATEHQAIVDYLEKKQMGTTYLLGGIFFKTETNTNTIKKFETFESFKGEYKNETIPPSTILIKASRGMALERILELL